MITVCKPDPSCLLYLGTEALAMALEGRIASYYGAVPKLISEVTPSVQENCHTGVTIFIHK